MRRLVPLVAVTAIVSIAAGCGRAGSSERPATSAARVVIRTFQFGPASLAVDAGTTVRWTNEDAIEHTVTAGTAGAPAGAFDGTLAGGGSRFATTFAEPGTYPYFCRRHPSMTAQVVVS